VGIGAITSAPTTGAAGTMVAAHAEQITSHGVKKSRHVRMVTSSDA
jgi:hypothetical protein